MQKQQGAPVCLSLEFRFLCASVSFCVFSCIFLSTALSSSPAAVNYVRVWVCIYMVWNGKEWTGIEIMKMSEHEKANCHWEGEKKQNIGLKCERLQFAVHGFWYIIGTLAAVGVCVCAHWCACLWMAVLVVCIARIFLSSTLFDDYKTRYLPIPLDYGRFAVSSEYPWSNNMKYYTLDVIIWATVILLLRVWVILLIESDYEYGKCQIRFDCMLKMYLMLSNVCSLIFSHKCQKSKNSERDEMVVSLNCFIHRLLFHLSLTRSRTFWRGSYWQIPNPTSFWSQCTNWFAYETFATVGIFKVCFINISLVAEKRRPAWN